MSHLRCAIYTRKSSEEGLDQAFNSLEAQREACEAYIKSQAHAGWKLAKTAYDDGGLSGGTLERPALKRLLADIAAGRISVVVVYKVDRLTRSLSDFARIVDTFDTHEVSFVSVTQQFNTTSSMGRLTLNMLLSFAQFEREVTGERIRDKIAASKRKGLWMGGVVPLGYDVVERKLVVNEQEGETVRQLFELYLAHGTVGAVKAEVDRRGLRTKTRRPNNGRRPGGVPFTRGHLYKLLTNPIYLGDITHKGERYKGEHQAIIGQKTWDAVQEQLAQNAVARTMPRNVTSSSLLTSLLVDEADEPLVPTYAKKGERRYRYYISRRLKQTSEEPGGWRLPALALEGAVHKGLQAFLRKQTRLIETLDLSKEPGRYLKDTLVRAAGLSDKLVTAKPEELRAFYREIFRKVQVHRDRLEITLDTAALWGRLGAHSPQQDGARTKDPSPAAKMLIIPVTFKRRGVEMKLMIGELSPASAADPKLVTLVARGHVWFEQLKRGEARSVHELVEMHGVHQGDVSRTLRLAFLAPDIVEAILQGNQPADLTVTRLKRLPSLPLSWAEQRRLLGFC